MIVLKDNDLSSVNEEFDALFKLQRGNRFYWRTGKKAEIKQNFRWVEDISYVDSEPREHSLAVLVTSRE